MPNLLSLEIGNFRSFYTSQTISFTVPGPRHVTALYGPNSSGKSNVINALAAMQSCVFNSAKANWTLPYDPFLLNDDSAMAPTRFAVGFEADGRVFFYEFSYNRSQIVSETLQEQSANTKKKRTIFSRDVNVGLNSTAAKNGFGKRLASKTRPETLIVTKGREDNNAYSNYVFDLFESLIIVSDIAGEGSTPMYVEMLRSNPDLRERTVKLLRKCDFAIRGIKIESVPVPSEVLDAVPFPPEVRREIEARGGTAFKTIHAVRDSEKTVVREVEFDFWEQESVGTRKFFEMAVPVIAALESGRTLFIDEFGSYIHQALASSIVAMFKDPSNEDASLVAITHNTAMMHGDLERDEIILVEKTMSEESRIVPLAEAGAKKEDAFEKRYRAGYYGAIPFIKE